MPTTYEPTTAQLVEAVATFTTTEAVEAAGYVFGAENAKPGDVAVVYSRGKLRAGIVVKVGRLNVTVRFTTPTAIDEARSPRYGWTEPNTTDKADKFAEVAVRPASTRASRLAAREARVDARAAGSVDYGQQLIELPPAAEEVAPVVFEPAPVVRTTYPTPCCDQRDSDANHPRPDSTTRMACRNCGPLMTQSYNRRTRSYECIVCALRTYHEEQATKAAALAQLAQQIEDDAASTAQWQTWYQRHNYNPGTVPSSWWLVQYVDHPHALELDAARTAGLAEEESEEVTCPDECPRCGVNLKADGYPIGHQDADTGQVCSFRWATGAIV